jgi:SAM-dependent methyltransferase
VQFTAPADHYDRFMGRYVPTLAVALADAAGVEQGMRALDVGCGPGGLARELAARLGAEHVAAIDPAEQFAAACRERNPGADVRVGVAEDLPWEDDRFDAVLSSLVVAFMRDAAAGAREMARVTRPGGIVSSCVWDYAGEMTLLRAFWDAAREVDPERAAAADEGVVMRWCRDGELAELWCSCGLREVRSGALVVRASYADFEDLWSGFTTGVAPSGAFVRSLDDRRRSALRDGYRSRLGAGESPFELDARAWAVAGVVP